MDTQLFNLAAQSSVSNSLDKTWPMYSLTTTITMLPSAIFLMMYFVIVCVCVCKHACVYVGH